MRAEKSLLAKFVDGVFAPVDIASLIFFRIVFGLLMAWNVWRYFSHGLIAMHWIKPRFLFKYYGFSWVQPWPGHGLYIHWAALGILALFIAAGSLYRVSTALFFLSYTYFFLLDQGQYVNHTYLICLFSFLLIFIPANRAFSVDAWLNPKLRSNTAPKWTLWLLRTQMGVVYFFTGLAKILSPDWLHGEPMRTWLVKRPEFAMLGRFAHEEWTAYAASYGALALDLLVVPLLLWRRTRIAAFCLALVFHLINARVFEIDFFPWLAIAATTLFLSPSWPRRLVSIFRPSGAPSRAENGRRPSRQKKLVVVSLAAIYVAIQIVVPLRHLLYKGGIEWTYMEPCFSWQLMLQRHSIFAHFYITDPNSGRTSRVAPRDYLRRGQLKRMGWKPDMLVQFAHHLASTKLPAGPAPLQVQVRLFVSVNGRKPELFIDPIVDLAAEPRSWRRPPWLLQIHEPLPPRGQDFSANPFATTFEGN